MISRTYAVDRDGEDMQCYKGFSQQAFTENGPARTVAVAVWDGEPELYYLDEGEAARKEFSRFADRQIREWHPHWVFLGFYVFTSKLAESEVQRAP